MPNKELIDAVKNRNLNQVTELLQKKIKINDADEEGNTALHIAAREGFISILTALINANANVNCVNKDGDTPLILAARKGFSNTCMALIKANAKINHANHANETALVVATKLKDADISPISHADSQVISQMLGPDLTQLKLSIPQFNRALEKMNEITKTLAKEDKKIARNHIRKSLKSQHSRALKNKHSAKLNDYLIKLETLRDKLAIIQSDKKETKAMQRLVSFIAEVNSLIEARTPTQKPSAQQDTLTLFARKKQDKPIKPTLKKIPLPTLSN
jgi:hypothetical protein